MKKQHAKFLVDKYKSHPGYQALLQALGKQKLLAALGLHGSSLSVLLAALASERPLFCIASDYEEAGYLFSDLESLLGTDQVLFFPSSYKRAIKYGHKDAAQQVLRAEGLAAIAKGESMPVIVSYSDAIAEKVIDSESLERETLSVHVGMTLDFEGMKTQLVEWQFERCDYVYEPGQFSVRGSIIDVYSFSNELPIRLDFMDDTIESIRVFEPDSQLSVNALDEVIVMPNVSEKATKKECVINLLAANTLCYAADPEYLQARLEQLYTDLAIMDDGEGFATQEEMRSTMVAPELLMKIFMSRHCLFARSWSNVQSVSFSTTIQASFNKNFDLLLDQLEQWREQGIDVCFCTAHEKQAARIQEILSERNGEKLIPQWVDMTLHGGFVDNALALAVLTDHQLFERYHKYNLKSDKVRTGKISMTLKELNQFGPDDYIVHSDYGIGRFGGLVELEQGGQMQEFVKLVYLNNDLIFVSLHSLHKLSKYRGSEGDIKLNRLGSAAWNRIKNRAKKQVKDIARDLLKLYAKRREEKGFAFSPDSYLQHELEASFAYEDTPDQERSTAEVKADMESDRPMDRLLCGDVGFGKTEVSIRAAFKAVSDSKQVAVLVPTTILAFQHYQTFSRRLRDFPVRIEYISRARTAKETKQILADLAAGKVDIVIGTHRLVSKDVQFKALGLLVIDEEQKFGVAVKEKLRRLQVNVDTLTMTATPIPRTLQFSLMGARDLSNINTPPPNRHPVATELLTFSPEIVKEAINFEMSRNGQVFIIHNRIHNIESIATMVRKEVPDARVVVAHGQMPPQELENIILDFIHFEYDVLIATTIIENGIDVPNANTIIINDAQRYGLSDLHQLRGRVGRGNKKAFCFLMAPPLSLLSDSARRRLRAIESFSELGSGIHIAMQDLDIRGAGNILGAEQSGFIADLGYETYHKVFDEAIRELKVEEFADLFDDDSSEAQASAERYVVETSVDSDLHLSFPQEYVPQDSERIALYRELDNMSTDEELDAFRKRMEDRFGKIPPESLELIAVPKLRRVGKQLGIEKLVIRNGVLSLHLVSDAASAYYQSASFDLLLNFVATHSKRCEIRQVGEKRIIKLKSVKSVSAATELLKEILHQPPLAS